MNFDVRRKLYTLLSDPRSLVPQETLVRMDSWTGSWVWILKASLYSLFRQVISNHDIDYIGSRDYRKCISVSNYQGMQMHFCVS